MGPLPVVELQVWVQIRLQLLDALVQRLVEGGGEELLLDGTVEAFAEAVGLARPDLGLAMLDLADRQKQLVGMLQFSTVFPLSVSRCSMSTPCTRSISGSGFSTMIMA